MALFKIFQGKNNPPAALNEGYAYFTYEDGKFYIDYFDKDDKTVKRKPISAEYADKITGAPELSWETNNVDDHISLALQWAGHDTTSHPLVLPPATLDHDGALSTGSQAIAGVKTFQASPVFTQGTSYIGYDHYIAYPQGGHLTGQTQKYEGLLKITLPKSWSNTMLRFKVSIYNYSTNTSVDYYVGGYNYTGTSKWMNTFAYCTGRYGTKLSNLPVSFGHDGTHCAITIGTADTAWDYPQVAVSDIIIGYSGNTYAQWTTGWNVAFIGSEPLPTISTTCTETNVAYRSEIANKLGTSDIGSATKPIYLKAGVPTACNDSLSINAASATKLTSNAGAVNHPVYFSGGKPVATTYCMAATNVSPTTALSVTTDLPTGIWYVSGTNGILGQSDGAVYVNQYSSSWIAEIYQDYRTGQLAVRGKNNGTWQAWRKILDSSNYTTYTVTKTGSGASGTDWNISIKGSAAKLTTAQTISLTGDVTGSTTFDGSKTASISATVKDNSHSHSYNTINRGTTGNWAGYVAPIDRALINYNRACRTAFTPAGAIKVEYTKNGTDWIDYALDDTQKRGLFSMNRAASVKLGHDGSPAVNMGIRITVEPTDRYCSVDTFYCWFSTSGHTCECTSIERSTIGAKETFNAVRSNVPVAGWSGPNEIQFPGGTYGGGTSQTSNYYKYRFTFKITKLGSGTSLPTITDLRMYGDSCWTQANNMMAMDNIYAWDINQNVTFPAKITAASLKLTTPIAINGTNFDGSSSITTAKWGAAKNVKITDSDGTNSGATISMGTTTGNEYILKLPATIKATLSGNASTATKFASAQKVKLIGMVTGEANSQAGWEINTTIQPGKVTNDMLAGSIANGKLVNSKVTIAGNDVNLGSALDAGVLRTSLGLSNAMHFIGVATAVITDGSTTNPVISGYDWPGDRLAGDVVIDKDSSQEYVWNSVAGKWERLGGDSSYKTVQTAVVDPTASGNSSTFIKTISQNTNGVITATKATIANLKINGKTYNGSTTVEVGTLGVAYGGTGRTSWAEVAATWNNGTTAGPTLTITDSIGRSDTSSPIPTATTSISGIVTTGQQRFRGKKILEYPAISAANNRYLGFHYYNPANIMVAEHWYDTGDGTNITTGLFSWRQYSPNTTANTATTGFHETFSLPAVDKGRTTNASYEIITTKNYDNLWQLKNPGRVLANGTNLNSVTSGNYYIPDKATAETILNGPVTNSGYRLKVQYGYSGNATYSHQFAYPADGYIYNRFYDGSNWTSWKQILTSRGGTITGTLTLSRTTDAAGTADNSPALIVGGTHNTAHIEIDSNEILAKTNGTTPGTLNLNTDGGTVHIGGSVTAPNLSLTGSLVVGTAGNTGMRLYGTATYYSRIFGSNTASPDFYFPNTGGTLVTHPTRGTAVGSASQPVYIAATGRATACSATVGSTSTPVYFKNGTITVSDPSSFHVARAVADGNGINLATHYAKAYVQTVDLTSLNINTWYPVTINIPKKGMHHLGCVVQLDSGTKPSWSSHNSGFTADVEVLTLASNWGATDAYAIVLCNNQLFIASGQARPVGYKQFNNNNLGCFYLRGGAKYHLKTDWIGSWTINTASKTANNETIAPVTTYPGITVIRSSVTADLNGNASTASGVKDADNGIKITLQYSGSGVSSTSWLACWDGYKVAAISPANVTVGNADKLDGYHGSAAQANNTYVLRDNSGYIYTNYINSNTSNNENPTISQIIVTNGSDNYYRKASLAHLKTALGSMPPTSHTHTWSQISDRASCTINTTGTITGSKVYNAVWNDYAEFRKAETIEPGRVVIENASGEMKISTNRLQAGGNIISDTFGSAMGKTTECKTPIAVAGRALAYTYEDRNSYPVGAAVCSGPNGTVSLMTREEIMMYPERIVGTVSEIPTYDTWGTGNVKVNGRIWIKVH